MKSHNYPVGSRVKFKYNKVGDIYEGVIESFNLGLADYDYEVKLELFNGKPISNESAKTAIYETEIIPGLVEDGPITYA